MYYISKIQTLSCIIIIFYVFYPLLWGFVYMLLCYYCYAAGLFCFYVYDFHSTYSYGSKLPVLDY